MKLPHKCLVVNVEMKNFNRTMRAIKRMTKSIEKLNKATLEMVEAQKALNAVLPVEIEAGTEEQGG